jgi:hypothetical protein
MPSGNSTSSRRCGFGAGRFGLLCCRRAGRLSFRFIQRFVGECVGFAVLLTIDVLDAEGIERLRHFLGALEERAQILALHFVLPAHLLDQQLGIALDANRAHAVRFRIIQRGDQPIVFGDVVGHAADVFLQLGDDFATSIADGHAVSSRPGIAARGAVNVCAISRSSRLGLRRSLAEEAFSTRSWRAARHQEFVEAVEDMPVEPTAGLAIGIGSRV